MIAAFIFGAIVMALLLFVFRCTFFGHRADPWKYGKLREGPVDGIGRIHGDVTAECERCGAKFDVCKVHIPSIQLEKINGYWEVVRPDYKREARKV